MATIRHKMGRIVGVGVCRVPVKQPALAFTIRPGHDKKSPAPLCQGVRGNLVEPTCCRETGVPSKMNLTGLALSPERSPRKTPPQ